jgi:hypothetical protein
MTIEVKAHNSKIIHLIPIDLREPISLIAKIKGFENIDDYVIQLVKEELESIRDGGQGAAEFGNFISDYLEKIIPALSSSDEDHYRSTYHQSPKQQESTSTESEE